MLIHQGHEVSRRTAKSMSPASAAQLEPETDTEITLGTGKMLGLFFGLVILCAIFFGMGFTMGKNSVRSAPELLPSPGTSTRSSASNRTSAAPAAVETKPTEQTQPPAAATNPSGSSNPGSQP